MNIKKLFLVALTSISILTISGCNEDDQKAVHTNQSEVGLLGAGATFPYPLYSKMFDQYYKENNIKINYQSIGSGGGIRQLQNKTVDFGASDAFLSDKKEKGMPSKVLHVPIVSGAVALTYNLPNSPKIKLTPEVLSKMYLGKIAKWNDPELKKINPGIKLPDLPVATVQRSDGSGTTFIFTDYLSKVSNDWKEIVGAGKAVNWPTGLAGKGNTGVAAYVKQVPGSIGYVSSVYAIQNEMPIASIKNEKGYFIEPTLDAISKSGNTSIPDDTRASITNSLAEDGYPISGLTWVLVYKNQNYNNRSIEQAKETKKLLAWMITDGQKYAKPLNYSPLSMSLQKKATAILNSMTYNDQKI